MEHAFQRAAEKSSLGCVLKGRTFRYAVTFFIFVITSGLQPARVLLFRLFQQPVSGVQIKLQKWQGFSR